MGNDDGAAFLKLGSLLPLRGRFQTLGTLAQSLVEINLCLELLKLFQLALPFLQ
jgi:hypothetical protein